MSCKVVCRYFNVCAGIVGAVLRFWSNVLLVDFRVFVIVFGIGELQLGQILWGFEWRLCSPEQDMT